MTETRAVTRVSRESDASDSSSPVRPIHEFESDAFAKRLKDAIGDRPVLRFAKDCGIAESNVRSYMSGGKTPGIDKVVAMANASGVSVDWLATGRGPKTRAEYLAKRKAMPGADGFDGRRATLEAMLRTVEYRLANNQIDEHLIKAGLMGAPAWMDAAMDYPDILVRLRAMVATLELLKATGYQTDDQG